MNVEELLQKRLCYVMVDMDKQQVVKDMVYKRVGATSLCLDIYYPEKFEHTSPLPAVLFLHGEASWEMLKDAKDWGQYTSWARLVAASGLIAVTAVRRPSERYTKLEEASQDVIDIVDYVTNNGSNLDIDVNRLGVWVCSAGGPAGLAPILMRNESNIQCIAAYYTAMDLERFADYLREGISETVARQFSPIAHLKPSTPPLFIARAGLDSPYFNEPIDDFVAKALTMNLPIQVMNHPEGVHGFDIRNDDDNTRYIIRSTLEFFKQHLMHPCHDDRYR